MRRAAPALIAPRASALQRAENSSIIPVPKRPRPRPSRSALQRAENSSIIRAAKPRLRRTKTKCSSASRKFLNNQPSICRASRRPQRSALQRAENSSIIRSGERAEGDFIQRSALQRAENSSIIVAITAATEAATAKCSSASRKFLNNRDGGGTGAPDQRSALQRAENSSII